MALTKYSKDTAVIENVGTKPEDRTGLDDTTFKRKWDENATDWKTFWNNTSSVEIDTLITAMKGVGWTSESLKGLADLISTNDGKLTTHKNETVYETVVATRDGTTAGVQTISGLAGIPKRIDIRANVAATHTFSVGSWTQDGDQGVMYQYAANALSMSSTYTIMQYTDGSNGLVGAIQNVANGQFEINWTKSNSGRTGTITMQIEVSYH